MFTYGLYVFGTSSVIGWITVVDVFDDRWLAEAFASRSSWSYAALWRQPQRRWSEVRTGVKVWHWFLDSSHRDKCFFRGLTRLSLGEGVAQLVERQTRDPKTRGFQPHQEYKKHLWEGIFRVIIVVLARCRVHYTRIRIIAYARWRSCSPC